jgi:outer membrane protein OmpA-like peptidoglycan-associated protein
MSTWTSRFRTHAAGLSLALAAAAATSVYARPPDGAPALEPDGQDSVAQMPAASVAQEPDDKRKPDDKGKPGDKSKPDDKGKEGKASRQETIGVLTGLAIGAAAGGPIGAIVGGGAGGWLGNHFHRQQVAKQSLRDELARSETEKQQLAEQLTVLDDSLHSSQQERLRLSSALTHAQELGATFSFRTDDTELEPEDSERLKQLAGLVQAMPQVKIHIDGYADPRGSDAYNLRLSGERAARVADVLKAGGVEPGRLLVKAHGAADAQCDEGDMDGYAFERRVTVRLDAAEASLAQVP